MLTDADIIRARNRRIKAAGKILLGWNPATQRWFVHVSTPAHCWERACELRDYINVLNHK